MDGEEDLLGSPAFRQAVVSIRRRAEKQTDWNKLGDVFVKTDLFDRVQSRDSQLLLGRRGTGKTHLLRAFQQDVISHGDLAIYMDCTRLGSGYSGLELEPAIIAEKYFIALLNQLGTELLDETIRLELPHGQLQDTILKKLSDGLAPQIVLPAKGAGYSHFNYRQIADSLGQILTDIGVTSVFLILDEWAQVPLRAQPYLAEYIKRALLSVPAICLKLLAVNYQCQFATRRGDDLVGLERGADVPDVVDLDRYLVYDEKRDFVTTFFGQLLFNHLGVSLGWDLTLPPAEKRHRIEASLFTQSRAFDELVRSAEGNCRDFLCIFSRAYFDEFRPSERSRSISIPNVVAAATSWYDAEKATNILAERDAQATLTYLVNHVLQGYKSRTFLVESSKAENPKLVRLLNERVVHRLNGTYSHQDRPGIRYDLFTVDYGAFARFRSTVNEVSEQVFWTTSEQGQLGEEERRQMVPVDDKRSIRRITFDPDKMEVTGDRQLRFPGM